MTGVGAILLFLLGCASSFSDSLAAPASLFTPLTELAALLGVCGGVVMFNPAAKLDVAAAMLGILPATRGGLLMIVPVGFWANDDCVAMDDVELDRVGDDGRPVYEVGLGGGEGATDKGFEGVR